jgi:hypothetical protein
MGKSNNFFVEDFYAIHKRPSKSLSNIQECDIRISQPWIQHKAKSLHKH